MSKKPIVKMFLGLLLLGAAVSAWAVYAGIGRTPVEILRYTERQLEAHPEIEVVALPVIHAMLESMGEPRRAAPLPPFAVPRLPPNPALTSPSGAAAATTGGERDVPGRDTGSGRVIRVGRTRSITDIGLAAKLARDGDTVEIDAGDYYADVASWDRAELTIRGIGDSVRLIATGASAEGKAIWVIRRGKVTIENIQFVGARVTDRNGAGIRFEGGSLLIRNCLFYGGENGILTTGAENAELAIENSEFAYNGAGDGLTHHLYVGRIRSLKVTGSYFHHANVGHLIKSRAAQNTIAYNRLTDESGGRASYELEFPNGGIAHVIGNIIQQSPDSPNSTMVSYGVEGNLHSHNALYLAHNTLVNDRRHGGTFLRTSPGVQRVRSVNNVLVGPGGYSSPEPIETDGDIRADWSAFALPSRHDYRLNRKGRELAGRKTDFPAEAGLVPTLEYVHPRKVRKLAVVPLFAGAVQEPAP